MTSCLLLLVRSYEMRPLRIRVARRKVQVLLEVKECRVYKRHGWYDIILSLA